MYANWTFAHIKGIGWKWAGVIWLYSIISFIPLDPIKFAIRYILSGKAWNLMLERRVSIKLLLLRGFLRSFFLERDLNLKLNISDWNLLTVNDPHADCIHQQEGLRKG